MKFNMNTKTFNFGLLLICIYVVFSNFNFRVEPELSYDVLGYYLYLPFKFIYGDLGIVNDQVMNDLFAKYGNTPFFYQGHRAPETGLMVMKYTMGQSFLFAPFFFIGHLIAHLTDYPADGFSKPYSWSIFIGGIIYTLIGIYFFSKVLRHFFSNKIALLVLLLIVFSTNYMVHIAMYSQNAMTHNYLFTLYAIIIWLTIKWHENPRWKTTLFLGAICGLATLIRPTEIVSFLIPLLWNVWNKESFNAKVQLIKKERTKLITFSAIAFCIISLQLIYFKIFTNHFFYSDYSNHAGEGLDLFAPYTLKVLFSFRKGWLLYTPIMVFAILGFRSVYKRNRPIFWPLFIYFLINLWFVSSWTCWWYAGSYSQRAMVPSYIAMGITFGYFFTWLFEQKTGRKTAVFSLIIALLGLNFFQTFQFHKGILNPDRMTAAYYFKTFGSTKFDIDAQKLLMDDVWTIRATHEIDTTQYFRSKVYTEDFEDLNDHFSSVSHTGKKSQKINAEFPYSTGISKAFEEITSSEYVWCSFSAWVYSEYEQEEFDFLLTGYAEHKGKPYVWEATESNKFIIPQKTWTKITFHYLTPPIRRGFNEIKSYVWLRSGKEILIDDYRMEIYEKKKH